MGNEDFCKACGFVHDKGFIGDSYSCYGWPKWIGIIEKGKREFLVWNYDLGMCLAHKSTRKDAENERMRWMGMKQAS